jgi:hypothetical protein
MVLARGIKVLTAVAGMALAMAVTPQAMAQGGRGGGPGGGMFGSMFGGGQGRMYEPSVNSRDLESFAKLFELDGAQKDAVKALFDVYQQVFLASAKTTREELEALRDEAREARDPELFREMGEKSLAFQRNREKMEQSFLGDFKMVLTDEQATKWPKFERMRRRDTTIDRGLMSGERVNLYTLVDDLKLSAEERAALEPALEQYEVDLDRELIERNKMYEEMQGKMREFFTDPEGADKLIKKGREASVKVRDVNRRYAAQLETQLPAEKREAFQAEFRRMSFPQVYRDTYANRVVKAAGGLTGLNEEQKSGLAAIEEGYRRDLANLQRDMEKAQEEQEMNFSISGMMQRREQGGRRGGAFGEDPAMTDLREKRRELENGTVEKIRGLLNEEQVAKLPTRGDDDDARGRRDNADRMEGQQRRRGGGDDDAPRRPRRNE